jgi:hypothetical protein
VILAAHQQAGVDEHVEAFGDEGVEALVLDQVDGDGLGAQSGCLEQWRGVTPDDSFDFRVPDDSGAFPLRLGRAGRQQGESQQEYGEQWSCSYAQGIVPKPFHFKVTIG